MSNSVIIKLDKNSFKPGEEIIWKLILNTSETIKVKNISISLVRKTSAKTLKISWWWINSNNQSDHTTLVDINLMWEWEYNSCEIPFNFIIPESAISEVSIDSFLEKLPEWIRSFAKIIIGIFLPSWKVNNDFTLITNVNIPWWINIIEQIPVIITE